MSLDVDYVDEAEVRERLLSIFNNPHYQPPKLPAVAMELMRLSQDPQTDFSKVTKVLEKDAVLTGEILKIAQSPLYAGRIQVSSIQQALSRMGLKTLRDIVMQVAMNTRVFRAKPYQPTMESLKRQGTAVAHVCRIIGRYTALDGEYAFLCGLMHNVGIAGSLIALAEVAGRGKAPSMEDVWPAVHAVHEEASRIMVERWELPSDVAMAAGAHHTVLIKGEPHDTAATVRLADEICSVLGYQVDSGDGLANANIQTFRLQQVLDVLKLTEAQVETIKDEAVECLDGLSI